MPIGNATKEWPGHNERDAHDANIYGSVAHAVVMCTRKGAQTNTNPAPPFMNAAEGLNKEQRSGTLSCVFNNFFIGVCMYTP
jgi:hypothetical protein